MKLNQQYPQRLLYTVRFNSVNESDVADGMEFEEAYIQQTHMEESSFLLEEH